jgi:cytochrome c biogenesis protein
MDSETRTGLLETTWSFFASIKLTVVVLLLLAATSVLGTLIPQNADPAAYIRAFGVLPYRLMHIFDLFDMYHSWWFQTLILMLTINIIVCTTKRWPSIWKIVSSKSPGIRSLEKNPTLCEFLDKREPQVLNPLYQEYVKKWFGSHFVESKKDGFRIIAEKGQWTRLGVPVVHLSIVIVLTGALVGSILGFDGYANIPEGGSINRIQLRNSSDSLPLGFDVRCDDFNVSFYESGAPKEFRSSLVILENGQEVIGKDIIVNDPLRYKGINFFQSSYGSMPPKEVKLNFTSNDTGNSFHLDIAMGQSVELPKGEGRFYLKEYVRNFNFRGTEVGEAVIGILEKPGSEPVEITLPIRFPTFDKMRKGNLIISVAEKGSAYYTGLQVTRDPGVPLVYTGFIFLVLGCWVAFFMSHQKIIVDVQQSPKSSTVKVYGSANRNRLGFETKIINLSEKLKRI